MSFKKILIGIDDNKYAEHAAIIGFQMAKESNAEVGMVHIVEPVVFPAGMEDPTMGVSFNGVGDVDTVELLKVQGEQSETVISRAIKKHGGDLNVQHFTQYGSKAQGIIDCSKEFKADLIVIGTHSRKGFDRLLMGSVAEHVVRQSDVPVLVVPFVE